MMRRTLSTLMLASFVVVGCAKREASLPGDSVAKDGAVSLATPKLTGVGPRSAEPVGAIEGRLFPVDLIMEHQAAISLDPAQRDAITKEVTGAQAELVKLQWELEADKEKLATVLDGVPVDEAKAKSAAASLMEKENRIKGTHLAMLVRIKNVLTADQQRRLKALRDGDRCAPRAAGDAGGD